MLFDPKWEVKTRTPSKAGLIAWLETQPPEQTYNWVRCEECVLAQYAKSIGLTYFDVVHVVGCKMIASSHPWTFGAALERARNS